MKELIIFVLSLIIFIFLLLILTGCYSIQDVENKFNNHIFIICGDMIGSGGIINDYQIITANHLLNDTSDIYAISADLIVKCRKVVFENDIALLEVLDDYRTPFKEWLKKMKIGFMPVFSVKDVKDTYILKPFLEVMWYQPIFDNSVNKFMVLARTGIISAFNEKDILLDREGFPMVSGSPIFTKDGYILAIATRTYSYNDYNYIIANLIPTIITDKIKAP